MKRQHEIQKREIHCMRFRSRAYWIVDDNSQTRKIVFRCVRWCEIPNMGQLKMVSTLVGYLLSGKGNQISGGIGYVNTFRHLHYPYRRKKSD